MPSETPPEEAQTPDTATDSPEQNSEPVTPVFSGDKRFLCHPARRDGERPVVEEGEEALKRLPPGTEIIEFRLIETAPGLVEFFPMRRRVEDCLKGAFTLDQYFDQQERKP